MYKLKFINRNIFARVQKEREFALNNNYFL